jgi:hypothetical protein
MDSFYQPKFSDKLFFGDFLEDLDTEIQTPSDTKSTLGGLIFT